MRSGSRTLSSIVALMLAATACGSSNDSSGRGGDDATTDTLVAPGDTLSPSDTRAGDDTSVADTTVADVSGSGSDTKPGETGTDASLGPYPSGPYGKSAGNVIANLQWVGYENDAADALVSTKPYGSTSMDAARLSGRRYALLHVSEFY